MNRTYKLYLNQKILSYSRRVIVLYAPLIVTIFALYYTKHSYDQKQAVEQKKHDTLLVTSSKTASVHASRENIERSFESLSTIRKENAQIDRQYIIETLTFYANSSNLLNFVIDNVSQKPQLVANSYKSLASISNLMTFEAQFAFDTMTSKDLTTFLDNINRNINGVAVINKVEIKRNIENITPEIIHKINTGEKVPLLGNKVIIHWFFVKSI